jgi:1-deoxyxylulose-5-phosphate synthase
MQYTAELHGWTRIISMQDQYDLVAVKVDRRHFRRRRGQGESLGSGDDLSPCWW